jgi:uncharacterized protein YggE
MGTNITRSAAILVLCVSIATVVLGQDNFARPRIISVTGTAEIKVAPDRAMVTVGVDSNDKELAVAKTDNDGRIKRLMAVAHANGVDAKNIRTSALTMSSEYSDEKIPKLLGYRVSQIITVTLTDVPKYDDLMTGFLKAGVNRVNGISFFVADPTKYREEARYKAVAAAREKAVALATELGQTIGKPWEVTEEAEVNPPYLVGGANYQTRNAPASPDQDEETIAGGEVTIRAAVRVSFQLE